MTLHRYNGSSDFGCEPNLTPTKLSRQFSYIHDMRYKGFAIRTHPDTTLFDRRMCNDEHAAQRAALSPFNVQCTINYKQ
jgi:hypothetical protein